MGRRAVVHGKHSGGGELLALSNADFICSLKFASVYTTNACFLHRCTHCLLCTRVSYPQRVSSCTLEPAEVFLLKTCISMRRALMLFQDGYLACQTPWPKIWSRFVVIPCTQILVQPQVYVRIDIGRVLSSRLVYLEDLGPFAGQIVVYTSSHLVCRCTINFPSPLARFMLTWRLVLLTW